MKARLLNASQNALDRTPLGGNPGLYNLIQGEVYEVEKVTDILGTWYKLTDEEGMVTHWSPSRFEIVEEPDGS